MKMPVIQRFMENRFLLEELTKRDFTKKYKRSILGVLWSALSPLLTLVVMSMVFTQIFGREIPHYTIYIFAGNLCFSYFNMATTTAMSALEGNKEIFSKVNLPKYMFVLSSNVSSFINFLVSLVVFFIFVAIDKIPFSWIFLLLLFPIACLMLFNIGTSLVLSALNLFFADVNYLYSVVTLLLMYLSAIFYQVESFSPALQRLFLINPVYVYIKYFRIIVIEGTIPGLTFHLLALGYALVALAIGSLIYRVYRHRFIYYV